MFLEDHADAMAGRVAAPRAGAAARRPRQRAAIGIGVPERMRISVDFPAPFSPIRPTTSLAPMAIADVAQGRARR